MTHVAEHPATTAPTRGTPRWWLIGGLAVLAIVAIAAGVLAFVALSDDTSEPAASVSVPGAPADAGLSGEEMSLFVGEPASVRLDPAVGLANGVLTAEEIELFVGAEPEVFLERYEGAPVIVDTGLTAEEIGLFVGNPASVPLDPAVGLTNGVLSVEEIELFVGANPEVFLERHASGEDTGLTAEEVRLFITGRQINPASDTEPPMGGELTMEEIRLFFGDNPPQYTIARFSG